MRHLLTFKPIAVHISFDVAKLFVVRMSERRGNLLSFLARWSSTSWRIASHPVRGSGWAATVAALRSAAHFLDVEVDAPPPPPPPPLLPWVGGGAFGTVRGGAKIGP
jgi:hypothetical protein